LYEYLIDQTEGQKELSPPLPPTDEELRALRKQVDPDGYIIGR